MVPNMESALGPFVESGCFVGICADSVFWSVLLGWGSVSSLGARRLRLKVSDSCDLTAVGVGVGVMSGENSSRSVSLVGRACSDLTSSP